MFWTQKMIPSETAFIPDSVNNRDSEIDLVPNKKPTIMNSRRKFISSTAIAGIGAMVLQSCKLPLGRESTKSIADEFVMNPLQTSVVREFVYYAHSDIKQVEIYAEKHPHVINATVDWGDGDFESAIGAAGHVGNKDIVNYLISKGARLDIFTMTMLGMTDVVTGILELHPGLLKAIGPHGFTLLHHAKVGKEPSEDLYAYLMENGLEKTFIDTFDKEKT